MITPRPIEANVTSTIQVQLDTRETIDRDLKRLGLAPITRQLFAVDYRGTPVPNDAVETLEGEILPPEGRPTR